MADQHNSNIPALTNQVASDIPDIKENLEFHKDAFQLLFETWSDTDNSANVLDSALGFSDGTYTYDFPTNGVAGHAVIMCGNSSTILWMYLNAAPPGWKVLTTGKDTVLAVYADSGDYAVTGGSADTSSTWTIDGITNTAEATHSHSHTHTGPSHFHQWYDYKAGATDATWQVTGGVTNIASNGTNLGIQAGSDNTVNNDYYTGAAGTGATGADATAGSSHTHTASQDGSWRPKASVGKLYQLDTA